MINPDDNSEIDAANLRLGFCSRPLAQEPCPWIFPRFHSPAFITHGEYTNNIGNRVTLDVLRMQLGHRPIDWTLRYIHPPDFTKHAHEQLIRDLRDRFRQDGPPDNE